MNVNGSRDNTHNITVDGVSNVDTGNNGINGSINLEAVEEFKLLTNAYAAEYGRSSGAQVSLVTKSGGSQYRGAAYWYRRHEGMNANSWINNRNRGEALKTNPTSTTGLKPINRQSDIGYQFGGPVPLGSYNKDKNRLFFFFAQEHQQRFQPLADPRRVRVPTAAERRGDFSQSRDQNGNVYPYIRDYQLAQANPTWGCSATDQRACFADGGVLGKIPQSRLYAPGLAILNMYPQPNDSGINYNYSSQIAQDRDRREDILRMDWQASDKWRVYGRWFNNTNNAGEGIGPYGSFVLGADVPLTTVSDIRPVYNYSFSGTGVLTNNTFLEITVGTAHNSIFIHDLDGTFTRSNLGLTGLPLLFPSAVAERLPAGDDLRTEQRHRPRRLESALRHQQRAVLQLQHDLRLHRQPDQGVGQPHQQGRVLRAAVAEGSERLRQQQRPARVHRGQLESVRHDLPVRQRRHRRVPLLRPGVDLSDRPVSLLERRVVSAGQLEAERPPDARLRPALLLGAAAVRPGDADVELHPVAVQPAAGRAVVSSGHERCRRSAWRSTR